MEKKDYHEETIEEDEVSELAFSITVILISVISLLLYPVVMVCELFEK